jgi:hypothetical protein
MQRLCTLLPVILVLFSLFMPSVFAQSTGLSMSSTSENRGLQLATPTSVQNAMVTEVVQAMPDLSEHVALATAHGLIVEAASNKTVRYLWMSGDDEVVVGDNLPALVADKSELEVTLQSLCRDKINQLEQSFGITISRDETILYGGKRPGVSTEHQLEVRQPSIGEVIALEYALKRSLPTTPSKRQLQVIFCRNEAFTNAIAEWELSSRGVPTVLVNLCSSREPLEYILLHELSHHSQFKSGLNPLTPYDWSLVRQLGWQTFTNPLTGETSWAIETQSGLFKRSTVDRFWVRCNKNGQPLNQEGDRVRRQCEAWRCSYTEIRKLAVIRPCTSYIDNPLEVMAEGIAMYRAGGVRRTELLRRSPELYSIVKSFDERLIARQFGSKLMRNLSGLIVDASTENSSAIVEFEKRSTPADVSVGPIRSAMLSKR